MSLFNDEEKTGNELSKVIKKLERKTKDGTDLVVISRYVATEVGGEREQMLVRSNICCHACLSAALIRLALNIAEKAGIDIENPMVMH